MRICDVGGGFFYNSYNKFMCRVELLSLLSSLKKLKAYCTIL